MFKNLFIKKSEDSTPDLPRAILNELAEINLKLEIARCHFNFAVQEDLIEAAIHDLQGLEARYKYLIRAAKDLHIISEEIEYCRRTI